MRGLLFELGRVMSFMLARGRRLKGLGLKGGGSRGRDCRDRGKMIKVGGSKRGWRVEGGRGQSSLEAPATRVLPLDNDSQSR